MSNHTSSILAAVYLDQLIDQEDKQFTNQLAEYQMAMGTCILQGSLFNPLQTMRLFSMNHANDTSYESDDLAAAVGVPACWFDDTLLNAPIDEVITALGKMALIYLSSLRNMALCNAPLPNVGEDSLAAVATMTEVLLMNEQRVAAR